MPNPNKSPYSSPYKSPWRAFPGGQVKDAEGRTVAILPITVAPEVRLLIAEAPVTRDLNAYLCEMLDQAHRDETELLQMIEDLATRLSSIANPAGGASHDACLKARALLAKRRGQ